MSGARADRIDHFVRHPASRGVGAPTTVPPDALDAVFVTDDVALSLIATVARWAGPRADRLYDADRLAEWLDMVGLPPLEHEPSRGQLELLRELRVAVFAVVTAHLDGTAVDPAAVAVVNEAADAKGVVALFADGAVAARPHAVMRFGELLATIGQSCVTTLTGPWSDRVRRCERAPCSHAFVDRSARGQRRWCTSDSCGNVARARRHREKVAGSAVDSAA